MSEVAAAVKPLLNKFIDFFDIFDLSFVVAGATFTAALAWDRRTQALNIPELVEAPWLRVVALILAAYISGMTCFAVGRLVRTKLTKLFNRPPPIAVLFDHLLRHGAIQRIDTPQGEKQRFTVDDKDRIPWLARYVEGPGGGNPEALYVRMWAEVRQQERLASSFSLMRRYWVSAATLDGLFVALLTWAYFLLPTGDVPARVGWVPSLFAGVGAVFCLWEARRYAKYQLEELVATVMHAYDPTGAAAVHGPTGPLTPSKTDAELEAEQDF